MSLYCIYLHHIGFWSDIDRRVVTNVDVGGNIKNIGTESEGKGPHSSYCHRTSYNRVGETLVLLTEYLQVLRFRLC